MLTAERATSMLCVEDYHIFNEANCGKVAVDVVESHCIVLEQAPSMRGWLRSHAGRAAERMQWSLRQ